MSQLVKPKVSNLVKSQLPEFVREEYSTFVNFLQAYYEYVENNELDLKTIRDLDTTLDSFIRYFKDELAPNLPYSTVDTRFLLQNIKDQYLAKGSEASFKLLFRILFNKDVSVDYPSKQILRASDGKWNQDVSVFAKILTGTPDQVVGKLIDVVTPTKIIRVLVDRRQYVEVEVERAIRVSDDVYEFLIDRRFFGDISVGDRLRYRDDSKGIYFTAEILATTTKLEILQPGSGFKVGDIYNIRNFDGYGSIMKVSAVDSNGGISRAQFIKFGVGYSTDFTTTISALSGQDLAGTAGTIIQRVGSNLSITEGLDGFAEIGTINTSDYNIDSSGIHAFDGTYAGTVLREFGISSIDSQVTDTNPAIIKCSLGALAKYPGYYINNDSFLDDAIYIQDSRYYQAYSYVLKIDEKLDTYKTAVKNLIHPAGMAVFGEYDIRNDFDISVELESLIKILAVSAQDEVFSTHAKEIIDVSKSIQNSTLNYDGFTDTNGQFVTMVETGLTLDGNRVNPYMNINKSIVDSTLNNGGVADTNGQFVTMVETGNASDLTRTMPYWTFSKSLDQTHVINDGTTVDNESVLPLDTVGSDSTRTVPFYDFSKTLNTTTFNFDNVLDNNSAVPEEPFVSMGYTAETPEGGTTTTRTGLSVVNVTKPLAHEQVMTDTTGTDLNRTVPALTLTTTLNPAYFISATSTFAGDNSAGATDSGGFIDVNPYAEAGYYLNDGGLYVGNQINF